MKLSSKQRKWACEYINKISDILKVNVSISFEEIGNMGLPESKNAGLAQIEISKELYTIDKKNRYSFRKKTECEYVLIIGERLYDKIIFAYNYKNDYPYTKFTTVIIHELTHIAFWGHSKKFYKSMRRHILKVASRLTGETQKDIWHIYKDTFIKRELRNDYLRNRYSKVIKF